MAFGGHPPPVPLPRPAPSAAATSDNVRRVPRAVHLPMPSINTPLVVCNYCGNTSRDLDVRCCGCGAKNYTVIGMFVQPDYAKFNDTDLKREWRAQFDNDPMPLAPEPQFSDTIER